MKQVFSALVYCHNLKIVHRDLKPENLLLVNKKDYKIKVIDFGTSKMLNPELKMQEKFGTPYYIAPEVLKGEYDEKCDIWSAGVILFTILSGTLPFNGKNQIEIFTAVKTGKYDLT